MKFSLNNREVEIADTEIEVGEGAYVTEAHYVDTGDALTEIELDSLTEAYQDALYQDAYEHLANRAHELSEGMER